MTMQIIKRWLGFSGGLCDQVREAADDLSKTASGLRAIVAIHQRAKDPVVSAVAAVITNSGNEKKSLNQVTGV